MKPIPLSAEDSAPPIALNLERLIHVFVTATTGAGKSSAIRLLLEVTQGSILQFVLDWEGEFATLPGDYVLVGKGGDLPATATAAPLLVQRMMELGFNVIADLSELPPDQRAAFAHAALAAFNELPRALWRDVLVVVDEAQFYAPEEEDKRHPPLAKRDLVNMAASGRKRGYKMVVATLRPAALDKGVAAQAAENVLVGRTRWPDDRKRALQLLAASSLKKDLDPRIAKLAPGHFMAMGDAFGLDDLAEVHLRLPKSRPPPRGQEAAVPAPRAARSAVAKVLEQLKDLPQEAEREAKDKAALVEENKRLKRELAQRPVQVKPEVQVKTVEVSVLTDADRKALAHLEDKLGETAEALGGVTTACAEAKATLVSVRARDRPVVPTPRAAAPRIAPMQREAPRIAPRPTDGQLDGGQRRVLEALARLRGMGYDRDAKPPTAPQVAAWSHYTVGGRFNNVVGSLRGLGLVDKTNDGTLALTVEGRVAAGEPEPLSLEDLRKQVLSDLPAAEAAMLQTLFEYYPTPLNAEDLAAFTVSPQTGRPYEVGGRFNNLRGHLRTMGLIEYVGGGGAKAADFLFEGGSE